MPLKNTEVITIKAGVKPFSGLPSALLYTICKTTAGTKAYYVRYHKYLKKD